MKRPTPTAKTLTAGWGVASLLFAAVLLILLHGVFLPGYTLFANDGPLGELMAQCHRLPDRFTGCWSDLGGVGLNLGAAAPNISQGLQWLLGPLWFSRLYAIVSLLLLGLAAWCFFRESRLSPLACTLGGLAAILNATFFSVACWGVSAHVLAAAMTFLALAALSNNSARGRWLRIILAGFAVGMGVAEGADVGAILSLYVAAFVAYQAWTAEGPRAKNLAIGVGKLALVTVCAGFLASQAIFGLVNTSIKGVVEADEAAQNSVKRWDWATQWSLQKKEALGIVVPGLFGYRLDTPDGGVYWGKIGRDPAWDQYSENGSHGPPPKGFPRYAGGGYYAGVPVAMIALWAVLQCLRRNNSVFNPGQRRWLWFWLVVALGSLLLAFGRFAPFYRLIYALPYFSTIRNPVKFLYPFSFALLIFFAYGVDGLQRAYMQATGTILASGRGRVRSWWSKAAGFEKYWVYGCGLVLIAALVAWLAYANNHYKLEDYLRSIQVTGNVSQIVSFTTRRIGWFVLLFSLSAGLMVLIFSGAWTGKRAKTAGILIGLLIVVDLGSANRRWIVYWDYNEKYASNPVIDFLRDKPYEHRVALAPVRLPRDEAMLGQLYRVDWLQQKFPFYNIQSSDLLDMGRMPEDLSAFNKTVEHADTNNPYIAVHRAWQLTNTRFVFAPLEFGRYWNQQSSFAQSQLRLVARFGLVPKPGVTEVTLVTQLTPVLMPEGKFALMEFTNALPRAKLYVHWQVNTNESTVLPQLFDPGFDPDSNVVVENGPPPDPATEPTNSTAGNVEFLHYAPKNLAFKADATAPSILLLNDHYDPNWKVLVDGQPAQLLRCNFLMSGVHLAQGTHTVEFRFQPPFRLLYVSLAAIACGLLTLGVLVVTVKKNSVLVPTPATQPLPPSPNRQTTPVPKTAPKPQSRKKSAMARNGKQ